MYDKAKEVLKKINVLVVEDEVELRDIIVESIQEFVQEVFVSENGVGGLELFQLNDVNLIISDIHMAKMTGLRMSHEIRKFDPYVPIIFLTAYDTDDNMLEAIEVKSRSVLKKPFDKKQLIVSMMLAISSFKEEFTWFNLSKGYMYNLDTKELTLNEEIIALTKKEQRLLELLLKHKNHIVPFSLIEGYVWMDHGATPDAIRMFINKLRKKIYSELIENLQGIGYKLSIK
jgi:DNA-binding response OmpR family regulator